MCGHVGPSQRLVVEVNMLRDRVHAGVYVDEGVVEQLVDNDGLVVRDRAQARSTVGCVAEGGETTWTLSTKVLETQS